MAAPVLLLVFICSANFVSEVSSDGPVTLDCPSASAGVYGRDVRIRCAVTPGSGVHVFRAEWKRVRPGAPVSAVSVFGAAGGSGPRFRSGWDRSSMEVWLQVQRVRLADEGHYTCLVVTDRGSAVRGTSLKVTARYSEPTVWSIPARNIEDNMEVTMFCRALGGFPRGTVHWFDQYGTNWTRSTRTDAWIREDGRFDLTSEFDVWRVSSISPGYSCRVIGWDGRGQGEAEINLAFRDPEKRVQRWSNNSIAAVIVVAGSLATGLLLLPLLQRRRPRQEVCMEGQDNENREEGPEKEEEKTC
ncbi:CD276 antigen-like isoform X1 [Conger conger]|uniref:CD276 antigen-like isoform X1 n=1 Tax=Conger conger TaxID=82655 RepID=UPI002A59CA42|nr:CD276 antigen-like isoform X1 [Conger conger]XP_061081025.1 CD276 antigen-like isoform X1 [Conger conger]